MTKMPRADTWRQRAIKQIRALARKKRQSAAQQPRREREGTGVVPAEAIGRATRSRERF